MTRVSSIARIRMTDIDAEGVDHLSPLEDQAVLVYRAVSHYATVNNWHASKHRGIPGRVGQLVMKRLQQDLFPDAPKGTFEKMNGLIGQVLRKTDACVCISRPTTNHESPIWFVADSMPPNITVVALSHAHGEHDSRAAEAPRTKKEADIAYVEKRLTPEEAGETMTPGQVTVKQGEARQHGGGNPTGTNNWQGENDPRLRFLDASRERRAEEHRQFRERVLELVTEHAPCTARDLGVFLAREGRTTDDSSAVRHSLNELIESGRVVDRLETEPERLVRGGGHHPKGKRMKLFGPAPGPVPIRTALPEGIEPYRSAQDWEAARKAELDAWCDKVIEALSYKGSHDDRPPRFISAIAEKAGLTDDQVKTALERLHSLGLVVKRSGRWYLSDNKPKSRAATPVQEEPTVDTVTTTTAEAPMANQAYRVATAARIHDLVNQLAQDTPVDTEELETLKAKVTELEAELEKQRRITTNLRALLNDLS